MKQNRKNFLSSPFIATGLIIMLLLTFTIWLIVLLAFLQKGNAVTSEKSITIVFIATTIFALISIITFTITCSKGFTIYKISENGVYSSLFIVFNRISMKWEDIQEISYYGTITKWILISKISLKNMSYNEIIKSNDIIKIEYSKEIVDLIKLYTNNKLPILNE